jgi:hypothetical protein
MAEQASLASVHKVIFDTDVLVWCLRGFEKLADSLKASHMSDARFDL